MSNKKKVRTKTEEALIRKALKKKLEAMQTLKTLEGQYETCTTGSETMNKRIQAYADLYEAEKVLEKLEK